MDSSLLLGLALVPLLAGPLLARWADRSEAAKSAMDSLIAVTLGGIVVLHIWPGAYRGAGWPAVAVGLLGFALPFLLHGQLHAHEKRAFPGLIWLAFLGLALHAFLDGVALFGPESEHHHESTGATLLALAVVLHRLPTALAIWWLVFPRLGRPSAVLLLLSVAVATVLGYAFGEELLGRLSTPGIALFESGVAGMLMHIVFGHEHRHGPRPSARPDRLTSAIGAAAGVALLVAVGHVHSLGEPGDETATNSRSFLEVARIAGPSLLLAAVIWRIRGRGGSNHRPH